jgi:hypothetical protein
MHFRNSLIRLVVAGSIGAAVAPSLDAQQTIDACYVDKTGILYVIDPAGTKPGQLPTTCIKPDKHIQLSWKDAPSADHGALTGLADDDHSQYLLANGVRQGSFAVVGNGAIPVEGAGARMMWYGDKRAFRAGTSFLFDRWNDGNIGENSAALGFNVQANGFAAMAFGTTTTASGNSSTALGWVNGAAGFASVAMGRQGFADHDYSFIFSDGICGTGCEGPFRTTAPSQFLIRAAGGVGIGVNNPLAGGLSVKGAIETRSGGVKFPDGTTQTTAAVPFNPAVTKLALGCNAVADHDGSFVWAAGNCGNPATVSSSGGNQFSVAAYGGARFITDALTAGGVAFDFSGVQLTPGGGAWSSLSARASKRDFRDLDGETVLSRIAAMRIQSWSYKAQDPSIRHLGPVAEDFYSAFQLGEDEHRITTTDIDGVNMLAIQSLESRTKVLRAEVTSLRTQNAELLERLARLEAAVTSLTNGQR